MEPNHHFPGYPTTLLIDILNKHRYCNSHKLLVQNLIFVHHTHIVLQKHNIMHCNQKLNM